MWCGCRCVYHVAKCAECTTDTVILFYSLFLHTIRYIFVLFFLRDYMISGMSFVLVGFHLQCLRKIPFIFRFCLYTLTAHRQKCMKQSKNRKKNIILNKLVVISAPHTTCFSISITIHDNMTKISLSISCHCLRCLLTFFVALIYTHTFYSIISINACKWVRIFFPAPCRPIRKSVSNRIRSQHPSHHVIALIELAAYTHTKLTVVFFWLLLVLAFETLLATDRSQT